jgi:MarR family transcriptional regulator, 2-MHQ and catechol-resistance regulon repressor
MHLNRSIFRDANLVCVKVGDLVWLGQRLADAGRSEIRASAPDIPAAELIVMGDLLSNPPSTITSLAERTGYVQSRVSTAVAGMVKRGWAQTRSDPADGRRTLVFIPEDVRREAQKFQALSEARTLDHLLADLPPDRRQAIIEGLEELLDVLRRQAGPEHLGPGGALHRGLGSDPDQLPPGRSPATRSGRRR